MRRFPAPLIVVTVLFALFLLPGIVAADQTLPFTPMGNVTGNYTLQQGNDQWIVNTNIPLSTEDICYPMVVWLILVLIGVSFIFLAVIFIARSDNVPSIAILMCGIIAFGIGYAASVMAPLVGEVRDLFRCPSIINIGSCGKSYKHRILKYRHSIHCISVDELRLLGNWRSRVCYCRCRGTFILWSVPTQRVGTGTERGFP